MTKNTFLLIVKLAFVALLCVLVFLHKQNKPRIMIVHSYNSDYSWVKEINVGVNRFYDEHPDVTLRWHYMDLKNHGDENFIRTAATIANSTVERWQPDVLIIFDDIAQKTVGMHYLDKPGMNIVFSGVNGTAADYKYDKAKNVTGILERKPLAASEDTINMLWRASGGDAKRKPRALLIGDNSFSFTAGLSGYEPPEYVWKQTQWQKPISVETFDEWKQEVQRAPASADILLVSDYRQLLVAKGRKDFVKPSEVMAWTEANSKIPVLGMAAIITEEGGAISIATSGYEQGLVAAEMSYAITKGKAPWDIPVKSTEQYLIGVRKSALERRHIVAPSIYEAFARATNNFFP